MDRDRTYLAITPGTDPLSPQAVTNAFEQLQTLGEDVTIEWLLLATDDRVGYYASIDGAPLARLKRPLRTLFPDSYDLTTVADPLPESLRTIPETTANTTPTEDTPEDQNTDNEPQTAQPTTAVTVHGQARRREDWQTSLTSLVDANHDPGSTNTTPATAAPSACTQLPTELDHVDTPIAYQVLLQPRESWHDRLAERRLALQTHRDTLGQRALSTLLPSFDDTAVDEQTEGSTTANDARLANLETVDPNRSFTVHARAVTTTPAEADGTLPTTDDLVQVLAPLTAVAGDFYEPILQTYTGDDAREVHQQLLTRSGKEQSTVGDRLRQHLPGSTWTEPHLVADQTTAPQFCLLDGGHLTDNGQRLVDATKADQTGRPEPPTDRLETYQTPGLTLGHPLTADDQSRETPVALPPALQPLHTAWFGRTGAGKSTALINAILDNQAATDGADILIDPKGDGMPADYLRAHYTRHGTLEDVYYFDCARTLPALPFFDIRDQLQAGIDRTRAVEDITDHYIDILRGIMGADRFDQAVRSPDIIRYLVKALFDPVHGQDAFSHSDLQDAVERMHDTQDAPPVTDGELARMLGNIVTNSKRSFDELMQGVANRIEKVPVNRRLGELFNHIPSDSSKARKLDLRKLLDEDTVIIFDLGGLRSASQRVLTLVILSALWTALRRRARTADNDTRFEETEPPLVNLYLEEAASVAVSDLLNDLLSQGRGFGLGMTLAMQYPEQLREQSERAYTELLNNVGTVVTGNIAVDSKFTRRFATAEMAPSAVGNRLRALRRGQWLVRLPGEFDTEPPRPFQLESTSLPPGHPDGDQPLSAARREAVDAAIDRAATTTRTEAGIAFAQNTAGTQSTPESSTTATAESTTTGATQQAPSVADPGDGDASASPTASTQAQSRVDSALPYTKRLPDCVAYDAAAHALCCDACGNRYPPKVEGMRRAVRCCHSLETVERDDIPVHEIDLTLTPTERRQSRYSDRQLAFLQAVYTAHQQGFDPLEYDLLRDSMLRLEEYVGIEREAIEKLETDGLLRHDGDRPHRLFTVTSEGRDLIQEARRHGVDHGEGEGDLSESSQHVLAVEAGRRYIEQTFVDDTESAVTDAVAYHAVADGEKRLDAAGLDTDGEVVVTLEAERSNNDLGRAVPADFDKMAACDPNEALWIVMSRQGGHDVLSALNDPVESPPRVEKTYSESSPPRRFNIDTAGLTGMYTLSYVLKQLSAE